MFINMKYYITTISAIFIALGIGILIGFNLNSKDILSSQQANLIEQMDKKVVKVKSENEILQSTVKSLTEKNEDMNKYMEKTYGKIIEGRLVGKNIGILQTTEDYFFEGIQNLPKEAGAGVAYEAVLKDKVNEVTDFAKLSQELNVEIKDKKALINLIIESLSDKVKNQQRLDYFTAQGYIEIKSISDAPVSVQGLVILGGSETKNEEKLKNIDKNVIDICREKGIMALGAERTDSKASYIEFYKQNKISTIDNVDELMGRISMVVVLQGEKGHYGIKETSQDLMPSMK